MTTKPNAPQVIPDLAQRVARLLRHEIGDLLQSVYSSVSILRERFPAEDSPERTLLGHLKARAELCRSELDGVLELLSPATAQLTRVDLGGLLAAALTQARSVFPALTIEQVGSVKLHVIADSRALMTAFYLLLQSFAHAARTRITLTLSQFAKEVRCVLERDGFALSTEPAWLAQPFATTQYALPGLALAVVRQAISPSGGTITVNNRDSGGICVQIQFPVIG